MATIALRTSEAQSGSERNGSGIGLPRMALATAAIAPMTREAHEERLAAEAARVEVDAAAAQAAQAAQQEAKARESRRQEALANASRLEAVLASIGGGATGTAASSAGSGAPLHGDGGVEAKRAADPLASFLRSVDEGCGPARGGVCWYIELAADRGDPQCGRRQLLRSSCRRGHGPVAARRANAAADRPSARGLARVHGPSHGAHVLRQSGRREHVVPARPAVVVKHRTLDVSLCHRLTAATPRRISICAAGSRCEFSY